MKKLIEELFASYYKDVYGYLFSLCRNSDLAEDLASEVFLEAIKAIAGFRYESDPKTWLFTIARRRWFTYLRKKKREPSLELFSEILNVRQEDKADSPEVSVIEKTVSERILGIIESEPEHSRQIMLFRLDGYSFYEISHKIGISESSARVIFFRTREKIRKILKEEGYE